MQCDICFRTGGSKLPFLCPTDARNSLYEPRIEHAKVLLEKAALDDEVTSLISTYTIPGVTDGASDTAERDPIRWDLDRAKSERDRARDRTEQIVARADELRAKIAEAKADIARRKAKITHTRSDLASAQNGIEARRKRQIEEVEKKTKIMKYRWDQMHVMTAQSRAFLCGEAARLYGLGRYTDPDTGSDEYSIAGVKIIDLRNMNSASAVHITTSLSHIAHLLVLASHYLALRLPAEITLPHRDYPLPTIFTLNSSYMQTNSPFPGTTPTASVNNSPSASRHEATNLPRPRPLFINKPPPLLAKEDNVAYLRFIEGATLLAYDVAWACKSQGIQVGSSPMTAPTFADVCAIGKNLFNLLIGAKGARPSPGSRIPSATSTPTKAAKAPTKQPSDDLSDLDEHQSPARNEESKTDDALPPPPTATPKPAPNPFNTVIMGDFSHGTAHTNLNSPIGADFVRTFKLPTPVKLTDQLKAQLMTEIASAEWEVVDRESLSLEDRGALVDVEADGIGDDDGVVVGAKRLSSELAGVNTGGVGGAYGKGFTRDVV